LKTYILVKLPQSAYQASCSWNGTKLFLFLKVYLSFEAINKFKGQLVLIITPSYARLQFLGRKWIQHKTQRINYTCQPTKCEICNQRKKISRRPNTTGKRENEERFNEIVKGKFQKTRSHMSYCWFKRSVLLWTLHVPE